MANPAFSAGCASVTHQRTFSCPDLLPAIATAARPTPGLRDLDAHLVPRSKPVTCDHIGGQRPQLIGFLAGRIGAQMNGASVSILLSAAAECDVRKVSSASTGRPHLLDRRTISSSAVVSVALGQVVTLNPAGGEEPGEMPRPVRYTGSSFSTWTTHHGGKAAVTRPTPLKYSRLWIFRKGNDDYEEA